MELSIVKYTLSKWLVCISKLEKHFPVLSISPLIKYAGYIWSMLYNLCVIYQARFIWRSHEILRFSNCLDNKLKKDQTNNQSRIFPSWTMSWYKNTMRLKQLYNVFAKLAAVIKEQTNDITWLPFCCHHQKGSIGRRGYSINSRNQQLTHREVWLIMLVNLFDDMIRRKWLKDVMKRVILHKNMYIIMWYKVCS